MKKPELKQLKTAAREINEIYGQNPPINVKGTEDEIIDGLKEALTEKDDDDEFTEKTAEVVEYIESLSKKADKKKPSKKKEPEPEDDDEDTDDEDSDDDVEDVEEEIVVEKKSKKSDKKAPVKEEKKAKEEKAPVKEEKKADKKAEKKPETKETKAEKKIPNFRGTLTKDAIAFMTPIIAKGKSTKKEIADACAEKFKEMNASSINTLLTDAKNPKYNRFEKLAVVNEKGIYSFAK
jgi:hypothetical protein